ncbi:MAG: DUF4751 family protein [Cyanobacteria bacterium J06634_5]
MKRYFFSALTVLLSATALMPVANASTMLPSATLQQSQNSLLNKAVVNTAPMAEPTLVAAAIPLVPVYNTARGSSARQSNNFVKYQTWGGSNWSGRIYGNGLFFHQSQANSLSHLDTIINYITWDGSEWTATVDPETKVFVHTSRETGDSHEDIILQYKDWEGSDQTMEIQ